jgi:hypothetical protein
LTRDNTLIDRERGKYPGKCPGSPPGPSSIRSGGVFFPVSPPAPEISYGYGAGLGKSATDSGNYAAELGNFVADSGNYTPRLGNYATQLGNYATQLGNSDPQLGNYNPQLGNYNPQLGNCAPQLGNCAANSGNYKPPACLIKKSSTFSGVYTEKSTFELSLFQKLKFWNSLN